MSIRRYSLTCLSAGAVIAGCSAAPSGTEIDTETVATTASTHAAMAPTAYPRGIARVARNGDRAGQAPVPTNAVPLDATRDLTYHGGAVIPNVKISVVFWGGSVDSTVQNQIGGYFSTVTGSEHLDWLAEYDTPTQRIGRGSYLGSNTITPGNTATTLSDDDIAAELNAQIRAGNLREPDENILYMVYLPKGITATLGTLTSCVGFCAYHNSKTFLDGFQSRRIRFGLMPSFNEGTGCDSVCGGGSMFDNMTSVTSHEMVEAITDPDPGGGWFGPSDEIGDICNHQHATLNVNGSSYVVQTEWSNFAQACISQSPWHIPYQGPAVGGDGLIAAAPVAATLRAGTVDLWSIGGDGSLWNAGYWNGSWVAGYRAPVAKIDRIVAGGGIAANARTASSVDTWAIGSDGALYNAGYWNGAWHDGYRAPIATTGSLRAGGAIAANSRTTAMVDTWSIGSDGALWSAGYWNGAWHDGYRAPIEKVGSFVPGGGIAVNSRTSAMVDTWTIGSDGALWSAGYWDGTWHKGFRVPAAITGLRPGAPLTAISRDGGKLDVWTIGQDGGLWNAGWWDGAWHAGYRVPTTHAGTFASPSGITSVSRDPLGVDVYVIDADRRAWNAGWWHL